MCHYHGRIADACIRSEFSNARARGFGARLAAGCFHLRSGSGRGSGGSGRRQPPAAPTALPTPSITGPLSGLSSPAMFDAGPFGKIAVNGILDGRPC